MNSNSDPECRLEYVVIYYYQLPINHYSFIYLIQHQCEALSINKSALHQVTDIDFVLDDICKMDFLSYFNNLKMLTLINQSISEIEGLDKMCQLEQIWLNENIIENIKGLDKLRQLKELYLGNNKIRKIKGLDSLVSLEKLWIEENKIETLEGLQSLTNLKELNVAGNYIEVIGMGLDCLVSLEELNISNNRVGNFKEVLNLNRLPELKTCTFQDPHYGENPICNLCNYQTYVLYHLPNLVKLDTLQISDDAKAFADATFMKKRMYYNMRIKTIQRNASNIIKLVKICQKIRNFKIDISVTKLTKKLNEITRELEERQYISLNNKDQFESVFTYGHTNIKKNPLDDLDQEKLLNDLEGKKALIQGRIHDKNEDLKDLETISESMSRRVYDMSEQNIHRLLTELETGGNIRFEEGKPTDKWFSSCVDLVRSRFNPEQMKFFGINGINVTRVTRIHNRFLRNRFEEKLEQLVDLSDNSYKRSLEYLFYGLDPHLPSEIHRAMEEGFRTQVEYQETGLPHCVSLVNSVASAEIARINSFFQAEDGYAHIRTAAKAQKLTEFRMSSELTLSKGLVQIPQGQLLVCKVFLSKCVADSTFPYFNPSHSPSEIWRYAPVDIKQYGGVQSVFRTKENDQKQRMWFVLDNALVLPEYLVEFEYVTNLKDPSTPSQLKEKSLDISKPGEPALDVLNEESNKLFESINGAQKVLENTYIRYSHSKTSTGMQSMVSSSQQAESSIAPIHLTVSDLERSDMGCLKKVLIDFMKQCHIEELMSNNFQFLEDEGQNNAQTAIENSMPPEIPIRSKIEEISELTLQNISREKDYGQIVYLNLFSNRIKKIKNLDKLINLNTLILSFNEIEIIEGLQECKQIKRLDLNHNFLRRIEGLDHKVSLQQLNMTNNWIQDIAQIDHLKSNCSSLRDLSLKCNPIAAKNSYRAQVFSKLSSLQKLDGIGITEKDKERVKNDYIALSIQIITDALRVQNKNVGDFQKNTSQTKMITQSSQKTSSKASNYTVTSIENEQQIQTQATQSSQQHGEWERMIETLVLNHKQISKIESLDFFANLRKLQLIDNCLTKIEGLTKCKLLEELSLEKNKITAIEGINHLRYLKKLDLGRNKIRRIEGGFNQLESLTQLSMEDNEISNLDGLENLQTLMELYLGNNLINDTREITKLKTLSRLIILDISGNNLSRDSNYRIYCIFHLRKLKVLDGVSIETQEHQDAKETFAGRLTEEILDSRLGGKKLSDIKELDLSSSRLRDFDNMFDESLYPNMRELNLSHNSLVTLRGFGYLPKLRILKIKANRLETLFCKPNDDGYPKGLFGLPGLEVLDVSYNNLHDLYGLQYSPLKDLKILNASNNDIVKVEFLDKLKSLRELDLSKNRIRQIDLVSFQNYHLITCLRLEDNGLRNIQNIEKLERLQSLFVSGNRLPEFWEVDRLSELPHLMEISLLNNPMSRKPNYRNAIIKRLPSLIILDGKEIAQDERARVEQQVAMQDQKAPPMIHFAQYPTVKVPVKLNSVNFDGVFNNLKVFEQAPTPNQINQGNQKGLQLLPGVIGSSIGGGQFGSSDMSNLIQVSSLQMGGYPPIGNGSLDLNNQPYAQPLSGLSQADKNQLNQQNNTRRPSTKSTGTHSAGTAATSQVSINQKIVGIPKTQYGAGGIKPPTNQGPKYMKR